MIRLTLEEVRALAPGELEARADEITGVQIDSRRCRPGDLFVAVGAGADFRADALERGAAAALLPDDPHQALAALARTVCDRSSAKVVAITGSTGKTSTKDILAALCRPVARTVAAEGGHNNEIGLPLTLLRIEPETEAVVAEMGMRGLGQISELAAIARPHVGVVTGVGPVHLELVGTVSRVAEAKAEVVAALPAGGTAVVPAAARELDPFLTRDDIELVRFGDGGDVRLAHFEPPSLVAVVGGVRVALDVPFTARHQAENTLAALAAYRALGLPLERAREGAAEIVFSPWRGDEAELPGGGLLVNDAYNANPVSMAAALRHLRERAAGRRMVAVLGDMAELGRGASAFHRAVGTVAADAGVQVLVAIGPLAHGYTLGGSSIPVVRWANTVEEGLAELEAVLEPGDAILVKASRALGLEAVAEALLTHETKVGT
ncbi:MAG: UDP-N-acetylmuramoyl-tripeptide--D-alanyl-D-alanine ligase [Actinomycetota bacterium]|nr:UDP-N-acetylmuramoyl-tripeptide--D-alanyl-D-alanine ligase [Actinomycetota bacterium]